MGREGWRRSFAALLASFLSLAGPAQGQGEPAVDDRVLPEVAVAALPREARETLMLIERGGPFPYERDGIVFGNFEKRLPPRERGYYREYTVRTPGISHRGARRIVKGCLPDEGSGDRTVGAAKNAGDQTSRKPAAGRGVPCRAGGELYYTEDHYQSFRRIRE